MMLSTPELLALLLKTGGAELAHAINNATPEQIAEAMKRCTPEAEEWGRRFEDMKEVDDAQ